LKKAHQLIGDLRNSYLKNKNTEISVTILKHLLVNTYKVVLICNLQMIEKLKNELKLGNVKINAKEKYLLLLSLPSVYNMR